MKAGRQSVTALRRSYAPRLRRRQAPTTDIPSSDKSNVVVSGTACDGTSGVAPLPTCRCQARKSAPLAAVSVLASPVMWEAVVFPLDGTPDPEAAISVDYDDRDLRPDPPTGVSYRLPDAKIDTKTYFKTFGTDLKNHLHRTQQVELSVNKALKLFSRIGESAEEFAARLTPGWLEPEPSEHDGYVELIAETPRVMRSFLTLTEPAREAIAHHTIRTSELMAKFVERSNESGDLRLASLQDLRDYCYAVAGIVGEMLCDLFVLGSETLVPVRPYLAERAAAFGEGLQLVNILKDSASDATEGRFYLPEGVSRSEVLELARFDLQRAAEYSLKRDKFSHTASVIFSPNIRPKS